MKVQCDGCEAAEAAVVCCADEAALCKECDIQVHDANKLASKHQRVPLYRPAKNTPCDICQEKTAYFFCLEDRALLCHNCDMSIHRLNPAVSSHRRFLITGVTASLNTLSGQQQQQQTAPAAAPPPPPSKTNNQTTSSNSKASKPSFSQQRQQPKAKAKAKKDDPVTVEAPATSTSTSTITSTTPITTSLPAPEETDLSKKTSIFEFLTESVPGWKFDELLNMSDMFAGGGGSFINTPDPPSSSKLVMDGSFSWPSNIFYEQSFSRSVPEMSMLPTPGLNRGMDAASTAAASLKIKQQQQQQQQQQQDIVFLPETDDAFIVPDLGLHSAPPEIPSVLKRRRTYSELDNIFLS